MSRMRIARTEAGRHALPAGMPEPDLKTCQALQEVIRRYLSHATATLLAEPIASADGSYIDWFTPLAGQPVRMDTLRAPERQRAQRLLEDRIRAIRDLAGKLQILRPGTGLAGTLLQATTYPSEETVFVVDGQPVITFWGYGMLPKADPTPAAKGPAPQRRLRWPWLAACGLLLLGGLSWGAFHFSLLRWPPWGPDYKAILAAERAEGERLRRLLLDRQGSMAGSLGQCALRARLDALKQEQSLLVAALDQAVERLRQELENCRKRTAEAEGVDLWERLTTLRQELAEARDKCAAPAVEEKPRKNDPPADEKRAQRERLRHVQVDGTLGCTGRSSRLFFKVPFDLGGGRFSVNFKGRDYDGTSITSRIDATYDAASQKMVLDLQTVDVGEGRKAMRVDRCQGTWRNGTFHDPRCKLVRTSGGGNFCNPLWLRVKTKTRLPR